MGFWVIKTGYWPVPFSLQIGGSFRQGQIWSKISTWKVFLLLKILYSLSKIWPISIKMAETSVDPHLPDITNSLVWHLNNIPSPRNGNVEKNLDIMKPTSSRHINNGQSVDPSLYQGSAVNILSTVLVQLLNYDKIKPPWLNFFILLFIS